MRILLVALLVAGCGGSDKPKQPPPPPCPGSLSPTSDIISVLPNSECHATTVPYLYLDGEGPNGNSASISITTTVTPTAGTFDCASGAVYVMASDPSQVVSGQEDSFSAGISDPKTGSCTLTLDLVSATHVSGNLRATLQGSLEVPPKMVAYNVDFSLDVE